MVRRARRTSGTGDPNPIQLSISSFHMPRTFSGDSITLPIEGAGRNAYCSQLSIDQCTAPLPAAGRPNRHGARDWIRHAHDAIAETRFLASWSYEWVVEGDIEACFDSIDHTALMGRVRLRVVDKRVLALVKAFLEVGILSQDRTLRDTDTGTPQGGILSPLLANIALSVLDDYFAQVPGGPATKEWERRKRRHRGQANYRLIRYADDFLVMVSGDCEHAEDIRDTVAAILAPMGLRLSEAKTMITHIDEGLDFLGWRIQRHRKRGTTRQFVYTYPAKKALKAITVKVKKTCRTDINRPLPALLRRLNPVLRGWCKQLLPDRGVQLDLSIPVQDRMAAGHEMAPAKTPQTDLEMVAFAATAAADGGRPPALDGCSTPERCTQPATATEARPSPPHGRPPHEEPHSLRPEGFVGSPVPGNRHAEFGRWSGETHRWQHRQGASGRPHRAAGKGHKEALRCLKHQLADIVYRIMLRDAGTSLMTGA